jgi:hypothetical protein
MEYNSKRSELIIPEYGRHVQGLIQHARTIADRNERQHYIERIIGLMAQMHPQNRNLEEYREKLWKHVFQIAEYDLDVTPPGGIRPSPEDHIKKPDLVGYPPKNTKFKHYGNNVQRLINKAMQMEDGPVKEGFVQTIGSYMKLAYRTWNKEHYVSDEIIIDDLESMSEGQLQVHHDAFLDNLTQSQDRRVKQQQQQRPSGGKGRDGGDRRGGDRKGGSNNDRNRQQRRRRK